VPDQPNPPSTVISNIFVRILWDEPYNNGAAILEYEVSIQNSLGIFNPEALYCDGTRDPVLSTRYCEIPMIVLR
jgi:hypothetical protein